MCDVLWGSVYAAAENSLFRLMTSRPPLGSIQRLNKKQMLSNAQIFSAAKSEDYTSKSVAVVWLISFPRENMGNYLQPREMAG